MINTKNKIKISFITIIIIIILSLLITKIYAYFTDYVTANGSILVETGYPSVDINNIVQSEVDSEGVHVYVENTSNYDCFVRVKIFTSSLLNPSYTIGDNWTQNSDGYWYYDKVLSVGERTNEILISNITESLENLYTTNDYIDESNIIPICEITEVLYDENGNSYADWNFLINDSEE